MFATIGVLVLCCGAVIGQPVEEVAVEKHENSIWKGTPMDAVVEEFRTDCKQQSDSSACIKVKVLNLLDDVLQKDTFKVSEGVSLVPNENEAKEKSTGRSSETGFLEQLEKYVIGHDLVVKPSEGFLKGASFKLSPRNLDNNELAMSVKLPEEEETFTDRGRKSKLKKILVPILVFVLLKAMTLIPLAIGVLGLKAWNALQLSFISFLVSISLAIFQLCKKVAADSSGAPIAAHIPFETSHYAAARNFIVEPDQKLSPDEAQKMAYREYVNKNSS